MNTIISDKELQRLIWRLVDRGLQFRINEQGRLKVKHYNYATKNEKIILNDCRERVRVFVLAKVGSEGRLARKVPPVHLNLETVNADAKQGREPESTIPQGNEPSSPTASVEQAPDSTGFTYSRCPNTGRIIARNQVVAEKDERMIIKNRRALAGKLYEEDYQPGFTLTYGEPPIPGNEGVEAMLEKARHDLEQLTTINRRRRKRYLS